MEGKNKVPIKKDYDGFSSLSGADIVNPESKSQNLLVASAEQAKKFYRTSSKKKSSRLEKVTSRASSQSSVIMVNGGTRRVNCTSDKYRILFNIGHCDGDSMVIDEMANSIKILKSGIYRVDLCGYLACKVSTSGIITLSIDDEEILPLTTWDVKTFNTQIILNMFTICPLRKGDVIKLVFIPDGHEHLQRDPITLSKGSRIGVTMIGEESAD